jgi:hypothetical protein
LCAREEMPIPPPIFRSTGNDSAVLLDEIDDRVAAEVYRRLIRHLRYRSDAENIDLMGLAGFCRNCLADWTAEASGGTIAKDEAREAVYGMPYAEWKAEHQGEATPEQIARMGESVKRNPPAGA